MFRVHRYQSEAHEDKKKQEKRNERRARKERQLQLLRAKVESRKRKLDDVDDNDDDDDTHTLHTHDKHTHMDAHEDSDAESVASLSSLSSAGSESSASSAGHAAAAAAASSSHSHDDSSSDTEDDDDDDDDDYDDDEQRRHHRALDEPAPKRSRVEVVLPQWMKEAVQISDDETPVPLTQLGLAQVLLDNLAREGIESLFAVQNAVIPHLLASWTRGSSSSSSSSSSTTLSSGTGRVPAFVPVSEAAVHDTCVSAPTGSGKTLCYVLPIVHALMARRVCRLRALVILPTRNLVTQVQAVFEAVARDTCVRVAIAMGQHSFAEEQAHVLNADVLVCTPGRLMDHLEGTEGFDLQHLRFLVVDEADRLLTQSYQGWLPRVLAAATRDPRTREEEDGGGGRVHTWRNWKTEPSEMESLMRCVRARGVPLQKLLFSATLTQNPKQIAELKLVRPRMFSTSVDGKYTTPAGLTEYKVLCDSAGDKPMVLVHLLRRVLDDTQRTGVICFTSSVQSTHRLALLLAHFQGLTVAEYSSQLDQRARDRILDDFRAARVHVLVCSDSMARGMDIDNVHAVVNYDVPVHIRTYVHRVGRTARAGARGVCYNLLQSKEYRHFNSMLAKAHHAGSMAEIHHPAQDLHYLVPEYKQALAQLKQAVEEE